MMHSYINAVKDLFAGNHASLELLRVKESPRSREVCFDRQVDHVIFIFLSVRLRYVKDK